MENTAQQDLDLPLLKRYYLAQTTETEDAEIRARLQTDEDFKEKAQLYQTLLWTVEDWENRYVQAHEAGKLQPNETEKEARVVSMRFMRVFALVASVVLLVVVVWWNSRDTPTLEALNGKGGITTMSQEGKAQGFDIISPKHAQVFAKQANILFELDTKQPCIIKIRDRQESVREILHFDTQHKKRVLPAEGLSAGKYVWQLFDEKGVVVLERSFEVLP